MKHYKIGISAFAGNAKDVGPKHMKILMDYAASFVPSDKYADTEVYLFATAGMRLLTEGQQNEILNEIYKYIRDNYLFKLKDRETNIRVITGEEEGLFGWISTNYLQHGFGVDEISHRRQTYNFVDMGGASTQIAFELDREIEVNGKTVDALKNAKQNKSDKNIVNLNINTLYGDSLDFNIFVITFLQYGVNETRRRYLEAFLDKMRKDDNYQKLLKAYKPNTQERKREEESQKNDTNDNTKSSIIKKPSVPLNTVTPEDEKDKFIYEDPCLPVNGHQDKISPVDYVKLYGGEEGKFIEENVIIKGTGKYDECVKNVYPLLNSTVPCTYDSCLFNNIYSPYTDFENEKFVAIGKYWDVVNVYHQAGLYEFEDFQNSARDFCQTDWSIHLNDYNTGKYPDLRRPLDLAMNCFRSAYLENIIHEGYKIPKEDNEAIPFTTVAYVNGTEASWALGALIKQISGTIGDYDPNATSAVTSKSIATNFIHNSYNLSISALSIISVAAVILFRQRKGGSQDYEDQLEEVPLNEIHPHTTDIDNTTDSMMDPADLDQELEGYSLPSHYDTEILEDEDEINIAIDNAINDHEKDKNNNDTEQLISF